MSPRLPTPTTLARGVWRFVTGHGTTRTVIVVLLLWPVLLTLLPVAVIAAGVLVLAQVAGWPLLALAATGVILTLVT